MTTLPPLSDLKIPTTGDYIVTCADKPNVDILSAPKAMHTDSRKMALELIETSPFTYAVLSVGHEKGEKTITLEKQNGRYVISDIEEEDG